VQHPHSAFFTAGWLIFKIFAMAESSLKIIPRAESPAKLMSCRLIHRQKLLTACPAIAQKPLKIKNFYAMAEFSLNLFPAS
jgi:hypothetical protein